MSPDKSMIAMELLQETLKAVIFTGCLAGTVPLSVILVGPPGTGKSKAMLQFCSPSLHVTNDVTTSGLSDIINDDKAGLVRHIVIPDFNIVVSHKAATTNLTVANLLTLTSEGSVRIDDGRRQKELKHAPIGIITAMTREVYEEHAKRFRKLGIGRRFTPLFFNYGLPTRISIQKEISNGGVTLEQLLPYPVVLPPPPCWPVKINIEEKESDRLRELSREMSENLSYQPRWEREDGNYVIRPFRGTSPLEFTPHMVLRTLAQGRALSDRKIRVHAEDVDFVMEVVRFTNYGVPVQL
jgi:hypothetical protein